MVTHTLSFADDVQKMKTAVKCILIVSLIAALLLCLVLISNVIAFANRERLQQQEASHRHHSSSSTTKRKPRFTVNCSTRNPHLYVHPDLRDRFLLFSDIADPHRRNQLRREKVRQTFKLAWDAYKRYAYGWDELRPLSRLGRSWAGVDSSMLKSDINNGDDGDKSRRRPPVRHANEQTTGWALTIFDSLDTLWILGFRKEFAEAVHFIDAEFDIFQQDSGLSTFEATIRVLGGLLSAYELSNDKRLLRLAEKVGWIIVKAGFEPRSGLLVDHISFRSRGGENVVGSSHLLAELGSLQLELRTLSFHLDDPIFDLHGMHLMSVLESRCRGTGYVCPSRFNKSNAAFADPHQGGATYTLAATSDSYFEYVVKQFVLTGKTEAKLGRMATTMLDTVSTYMIQRMPQQHQRHSKLDTKHWKPQDNSPQRVPPEDQVVFPTSWTGRADDFSRGNTDTLEHLTCFAGGMFLLAASHMGQEQQQWAQLGADLAQTCYWTYSSTRTGLGPEETVLREIHRDDEPTDDNEGNNNNQNDEKSAADAVQPAVDISVLRNKHFLRPEVIESVFYAHRIGQCRGDSKSSDSNSEIWRDRAWAMFQSILDACLVDEQSGFAGLLDVTASKEHVRDRLDDSMPSFFMAETLKYYFLIFSEDSVLDLDEWVFNTEAHPFRIRKRDPMDVARRWAARNGGKPRWVAPHIDDGIEAFYKELDGVYN